MEHRLNFQRRQLTDDELARRITALEQKHRMTSAAFLLRFNAGELGDDADFIDWSGLLFIASKVGLRWPLSGEGSS